MTEALLGVYPDIFKGGAEFSGVPIGGQWTPVTHTAQQWGDLARACYPGYSGHRPRVQLWHGTADGTVNYTNQLEAIMQWGNVLGLSTNPTYSNTVTIAGYHKPVDASSLGGFVRQRRSRRLDGNRRRARHGCEPQGAIRHSFSGPRQSWSCGSRRPGCVLRPYPARATALERGANDFCRRQRPAFARSLYLDRMDFSINGRCDDQGNGF